MCREGLKVEVEIVSVSEETFPTPVFVSPVFLLHLPQQHDTEKFRRQPLAKFPTFS